MRTCSYYGRMEFNVASVWGAAHVMYTAALWCTMCVWREQCHRFVFVCVSVCKYVFVCATCVWAVERAVWSHHDRQQRLAGSDCNPPIFQIWRSSCTFYSNSIGNSISSGNTGRSGISIINSICNPSYFKSGRSVVALSYQPITLSLP